MTEKTEKTETETETETKPIKELKTSDIKAWLHCGFCEVGQEVSPIVAVVIKKDGFSYIENGHFKYHCCNCGNYNYQCFGVEDCRA